MPEIEMRKFTFTDETSEGIGMAYELKKARALEYIAHYLGGIDSSLAKIAATLTQDSSAGPTLMHALQDIAEGLKKQ